MKKSILIVTTLLFAFPGAVCAHAPSAVEVSAAGTKVEVTVRHGVGNPKTHYIRQIRVVTGGAEIATRDFTSQTDHNTQVATLEVPSLQKGDTVTIEATCSQTGKLSKEATVK